MKKLLIISSDYTGHGHRSIAQSLLEQFEGYDDMEVRVQEGFDLMGKTAARASKLYGPITRNMVEMWKIFFVTSQWSPGMATDALELMIHDRFMSLIRRWTPDAILAVHPVFNACLINILRRYRIPMQFYTLIADLVDIHTNWVDVRADRIFCPSQESYDFCLHRKAWPSRLMLTGFPVRRQFIEAAKAHPVQDYHPGRPLEALVMSGGEGSGNLLQAAQILLTNTDSNVHVICGRNAAIKEKFEETLLQRYPDRLHIYGFLKNVEEVMVKCDVVIARGSPNTMMEAVTCNVPLIITGSLPGQEAHNPLYAEEYGLGIASEGIHGLRAALDRLLADEGKLLNEIKASQREFRSLDGAEVIAHQIYAETTAKHFEFPLYRPYMPVNDRTMRRLKRRMQMQYLPGLTRKREE